MLRLLKVVVCFLLKYVMLFTRFNACHSFVSSYHRITRTSSHGFKGNNKLIRYLSTAYMRSDSDGLKELNLEGVLKKSNILKKTCVYKSNSGEMIHAVEEELSVKLSVPLLTINEIVENEQINTCITVQGNNSVDIFDYSIGLVSIQQTGQKLRYKYMRKAPPFIVNLSSDSMLGKRLEQAKKGKQEMILKAAIPKGVDNLVVYDLTAGFGRDSAIMASSSVVKKVVMVERDPIVSILLWDALRRLIKSDNMSHLEHTLAEKLEMVCDDSCSVLADIYEWRKVKPDICFLDVMFPPRTKSSAVKKNMQMLHDLLDSKDAKSITEDDESIRNEQEAKLLDYALKCATKRVVVKRPIHSPPISSSETPSFEVRGSTNRFDVYLTD